MTTNPSTNERARNRRRIVAAASMPLLIASQLEEAAAFQIVPNDAVDAIYSAMEGGNGLGAKDLFSQAVLAVQAESDKLQRMGDRDWILQESGLSSQLQLAALQWNSLTADKALVSQEALFSDRADRDW